MSREAGAAAPAALLLVALLCASGRAEEPASAPYQPKTAISIKDGFWHSNGAVTAPESFAEGLLVNVRMAQAIFDDRNPATRPKGFDAEANTSAFIARIPEYLECGVRAFSIGLQGGDPGYAGASCSAFGADGALDPAFRRRAERVIEACDQADAAVILVVFHPLQDQVLKDSAALRRAIAQLGKWLGARGYTNVLIDLADEYMAPGWEHEEFNDPLKMGELVKEARQRLPRTLIGATRQGTARIDAEVGNPSDFMPTHLSGLPAEKIAQRVANVLAFGKPLVCTADVRAGKEAAASGEAALAALCSWGFAGAANERYPFRYEGAKDDPLVYAKLRELTRKRGK